MTTATTCPNTRVAPVARAPRRVRARRGARLRREHERGEFRAQDAVDVRRRSAVGEVRTRIEFDPQSARDDGKDDGVIEREVAEVAPGYKLPSPATAPASTPSDPTSRAPSRRNAGPRAANTARISAASLSYPCVPRYVPIFSPHAE